MVDWTPELVERVRTLWERWVPAKRIALLIGQGATKNSIIGQAHRKKWSQRLKSPKRKKRRKHITPAVAKTRERPPQPPRPKAPPPAPVLVSRPPPPPRPRKRPGTYTLLDLRPHECKWPVNDPPRGKPFLFCGERQFDGMPYCEYHARLGFSGKGTARRSEVAGWQPRAPGW